MTTRLKHEPDGRIVLTVENAARRWPREARTVVSIDAWSRGNAARCDAVACLRSYNEEHAGTVDIQSNRIIATHGALASLQPGQARALGLPERPPFVFAADTSGVIGSTDFQLVARWLEAGSPVPTNRRGAFLETSQGTFLIPEPLYSALELVDGFGAADVEFADHWTTLAKFRSLFDTSDADGAIEMSRFLQGLRIYTGTSLSLTLHDGKDGVDFDPVIFDASTVRSAEESGRVVTENDGALAPEHLGSLQRDPRTGFRAFESAKRCYLLGSNTYLIVDDDLESALQVVREKQQSSPEERRAFAANPRAWIAERLADSGSRDDLDSTEEVEARADTLFVETPEFADRARGIGLWQEPELPFVSNPPNVWLPERFSIELGGVWVDLVPDDVEGLRQGVDSAIAKGTPFFEYNGQSVPANDEVREKLAEIVAVERPEDNRNRGAPIGPRRRTVVLVHENFVVENWSPETKPRNVLVPRSAPDRVRTALLKHQSDALCWQIDAWRSGLPGVLNADDQGLGKTIQTLAFLAWLQDNLQEGPYEERRPVLVVAPTGLLRVWEDEANEHLAGAGLGACIRAYGGDLREARKRPGRDTDDGMPRLEFDQIRTALDDGRGHRWWVLTSYETLANYQHSFRQIRFSVVVFDEIQKVKNVKTLTALAARSVTADFRIGLTGTPIENQIADLWAVMDIVCPGRLNTLQEYMDRYRDVTEAKMRILHACLFKPLRNVKNGYDDFPPVAQRRLKEDAIEGLPRKDYRLYPTTMPEVQSHAYEAARAHLADGAQGAALKLLHHIRGVSLHPMSPDEVRDIGNYFDQSARFAAMRRVLDRIRVSNERVLIFTEDRRVQAFVAQWMRTEYDLDDVPIINGSTSIPKRRQRVRRFQERMDVPGFAAMILSPRAAGVGLTLTAATHVIHLSRWWNPAVEEQCNDRIYRIGQRCDVTVHVPLAIHPGYKEQSFDCVLNSLMRRKMSLARAALWPPTHSDDDISRLMADLSSAQPVDLHKIDELDWAAFEDWVLQRAKESGEWEVARTPSSGDGGADAVLRHRQRDSTVLVQVKHTTASHRTMDAAAVLEVAHAASRYEVRNPQLAVVTNASEFTRAAREEALERGVMLIDRHRLGLWPNHAVA